MTSYSQTDYKSALHFLSTAYHLSLKAFNAQNLQNLIFIILNDTIHVQPYDQAVLWKISAKNFKLLGVSGQTTYATSSQTINDWKTLLSSLKDLSQIKLLKQADFPNHLNAWKHIQEKKQAAILWVPLLKRDHELIGLWLEKWEDPEAKAFSEDKTHFLKEFIVPGYAAAWNKISPLKRFWRLQTYFTKQKISVLALLLILCSLLIHVPLRVVAPCEVVAKDPYIITSPLDGIIAKIDVKPGQQVKVGDPLYQYDPRIPRQELKIAEKQLEMTESEYLRTLATSLEEHQTLAELATLNIKKQKAELDLEYAKARAKELIGKSPLDGVALIENPDEWQGKPVKVGEKIMVISNPQKTQVKIWIPENDNIVLDSSQPVKVFLNPDPVKSYEINLDYVSDNTILSEQHVSSFIAEGEWVKPDPEAKLGLKGTAILYGKKVPLIYYIFRKPLESLRNFIGI